MKTAEVVIIGRLGRPHGVLGWMRLISFADPPDNILEYPDWLIQKNARWQPLAVEAVESRPPNFLVKLAGCNSPEAARLYTNKEIAIPKSALPQLPTDTFYWTDLEGLTVVNQDDVVLGQVDHLFSTGANDVLVVKGEKEYLLPYITQVVLKVDLQQQQIRVDWNVEDSA